MNALTSLLKTFGSLAFFLLCGFALNAQSLKTTVKEFSSLLSEKTIEKDAFLNRVKPFIDPRENADSLALDYFNNLTLNLKNESYPVRNTIELIVEKPEKEAMVLISSDWHMPDGKLMYVLNKTYWRQIDGKWYRMAIPSEYVEVFEKK
ncbi:MAG: hypothetical protein R2792_06260 [Saprospiraceae bacterium]